MRDLYTPEHVVENILKDAMLESFGASMYTAAHGERLRATMRHYESVYDTAIVLEELRGFVVGMFGDAEPEEIEVSEEEFRAMREELKEVRQRVNVLTQARGGGGDGEVSDEVRERVERLEQRVSDVQASGGSGGGVTPRQVAEAPAVKTIEERVAELEADVTDLEEYIYEWNEAAETYMRALRRAVEDKLGVSLQSYFETQEDGPGDVSDAR